MREGRVEGGRDRKHGVLSQNKKAGPGHSMPETGTGAARPGGCQALL